MREPRWPARALQRRPSRERSGWREGQARRARCWRRGGRIGLCRCCARFRKSGARREELIPDVLIAGIDPLRLLEIAHRLIELALLDVKLGTPLQRRRALWVDLQRPVVVGERRLVVAGRLARGAAPGERHAQILERGLVLGLQLQRGLVVGDGTVEGAELAISDAAVVVGDRQRGSAELARAYGLAEILDRLLVMLLTEGFVAGTDVAQRICSSGMRKAGKDQSAGREGSQPEGQWTRHRLVFSPDRETRAGTTRQACKDAAAQPRRRRSRNRSRIAAARPVRFSWRARPTARLSSGTSRLMVLPAATMAPSPIRTGATSALFEPTKTPVPISVRYFPNPS